MTKKSSLGNVPRKYIYGLFLIIVGILVYYFRPLQTCDWWNIFCHAGSLAITPIFIIISIVLILAGVLKLIFGKD